ncbi:MAG TPA: type II secretion system minor pseudopilin GspI [Wenzhouxiangellaceae bacterium]|nr:type II secretion system minor pseudopilin GspI [Wenzhouxiangellaceae bacterium]
MNRLVGSRRANGFTLIEVLVALFVVATALATLGFAGAQALKNQAVLEERTLALWAADNQLADIRLQRSLQPGTSSGNVRIGNRDWRWRRQVQLAPGGQLWRIDVTILDADQQPIYIHTGFESR